MDNPNLIIAYEKDKKLTIDEEENIKKIYKISLGKEKEKVDKIELKGLTENDYKNYYLEDFEDSLNLCETNNSFLFHLEFVLNISQRERYLKYLDDYSLMNYIDNIKKVKKTSILYDELLSEDNEDIHEKLNLIYDPEYRPSLSDKLFLDKKKILLKAFNDEKSMQNYKASYIFLKYKMFKISVKRIIPKIKLINYNLIYCLQVFNFNFVEKNKNNFKLLIGDKEIELQAYINKKYIKNYNNLSFIKLKQIKKPIDISSMFENISTLKSIPNISNIDTSEVINMSEIFKGCKLLETLPDISKWNTSKVKYMTRMFYECYSLKYLPDLSNWKTENVTDMGALFSSCSSLKTLPDISKWNMSNVTNINALFDGCSSLQKLPMNISFWDTSNLINIGYLFSNCHSLKELPDILKWNTTKIKYNNRIFSSCKSLEKIPDISNWNFTDLNEMFLDCVSLKKMQKKINYKSNNPYLKYVFCNCSSLRELPDISEWYAGNIKKWKEHLLYAKT